MYEYNATPKQQMYTEERIYLNRQSLDIPDSLSP